MALRLYDTSSRQKIEFIPLDRENIRLYVCGPTVYDFAHIGNARPVIVFDVLFRLLRHLYGASRVTYVRNVTDVDDKINLRAHERGISIRELTDQTLQQFHADVEALGCLPPTQEPRATDHIEAMRKLIDRLVERNIAYVAEDHVLFSVTAMESLPNAPRYGSLARRSLDDMLAGARVDVAPYKRDPMDFVLWKPSREAHEPKWPSPADIVVQGRPGWHIECSAMSMAELLEPFGGGLTCDDPNKNIFDIHGGGIDLAFPHHENEIAQTCCALGTPRMANIWMHNGFLQVEGRKMSKSLGNFVTIRDLLNERPGDRFWGEIIRLNMLRTHYREPIDWTRRRLEETETIYLLLRRATVGANRAYAKPSETLLAALEDDLNTHEAVLELQRLARSAQASPRTSEDYSPKARDLLVGCLDLLGFERMIEHVKEDHGIRQAVDAAFAELDAREMGLDVVRIKALVQVRNAARAAKNWTESDRIREELLRLCVVVKDNKDGTTTWEVKR